MEVLLMYTTRSVRPINRINNAEIDVRYLPNATPYARMKQRVWYNLISNASNYSGNTENPAVEIGSFLRDDHVCYYVKDDV
jgi:light-regulated signal transduction histidine kinase (bacteriophytochrome)